MPKFTFSEKTDMVLVFGESHGNSRDALTRYVKKFPNRTKPSYTMFLKLVGNLRTYGAFQKPDRKPRTSRFANDDTEERALALAHQNPHISSRAIAEEVGCSHQTILRILHKRQFHFTIDRFENDPELINFYTGFRDYSTFKAVFKALEPTAEKMIRWNQAQKSLKKTDKKEVSIKHERIALVDQFFMFLLKIRRGWSSKELAIHFKVSPTTINSMLVTWTNYLYFVLGSIPLWISKELNQKYMPDVFKKAALAKTRIIIYIHDLKILKSGSKKDDFDSYMPEMEHTTFKGLTALSPCGSLVFASTLFPGSVSDRELMIRSRILDLLQPQDEVMIERDFPVADLLANRRLKLSYPPFIQQYSQHFPLREKETPDMILLRDHVLKINQRLKEYKIFYNELNVNMITGILNQLWTVCCILTNFHGIETGS